MNWTHVCPQSELIIIIIIIIITTTTGRYAVFSDWLRLLLLLLLAEKTIEQTTKQWTLALKKIELHGAKVQ